MLLAKYYKKKNDLSQHLDYLLGMNDMKTGDRETRYLLPTHQILNHRHRRGEQKQTGKLAKGIIEPTQ